MSQMLGEQEKLLFLVRKFDGGGRMCYIFDVVYFLTIFYMKVITKVFYDLDRPTPS